MFESSAAAGAADPAALEGLRFTLVPVPASLKTPPLEKFDPVDIGAAPGPLKRPFRP